MKKALSLLLVVVFVLAFSSVAFAFSEESDDGFEASIVFTYQEGSDGGAVWNHAVIEEMRFHMSRGVLGIYPSEPGEKSSEDSNLYGDEWRDGSLVIVE